MSQSSPVTLPALIQGDAMFESPQLARLQPPPSSAIDKAELEVASDDPDEEEFQQDDPHHAKQESHDILLLKKRGRKRGATKYSEGDGTAVLNSIEFLYPSNEEEWEKVAAHYNSTYAIPFCRQSRTGKALRARFREMLWGTPSGGGKSKPLQQRARSITMIPFY